MPIVVCPSCGERISIDELSGTYICPECNDEFQAEDAEEVDEDSDTDEDYVEEAQKKHNNTGGIIGLIILVVIILFLVRPKWTLFVCSGLQNPGYRYECSDNAFVFKNEYKSLDKCIDAGNNYLGGYSGFECGYKCKIDNDFGLWVCNRINE